MRYVDRLIHILLSRPTYWPVNTEEEPLISCIENSSFQITYWWVQSLSYLHTIEKKSTRMEEIKVRQQKPFLKLFSITKLPKRNWWLPSKRHPKLYPCMKSRLFGPLKSRGGLMEAFFASTDKLNHKNSHSISKTYKSKRFCSSNVINDCR